MIINLSRIDFGGVATGGGTLVPLTVEASNENRTFEPSSYDADGFNGVTGFDCSICNIMYLSGIALMPNLTSLKLNNNTISNLQTYPWQRLTVLVISYNNLQSITNVGNNAIDSIPFNE